MVRTTLGDADTVWVGQQVDLLVELLAPGYFASGVDFDLPDPAGVLILPPNARPVVGDETIGDTRYTVQRHRLSVWPTRAGDQSVPALTARFRYKRNPLDTDVVSASVTTDPIAFTVQVPPGTEGLGTVISARGLEVKESWDPEPGDGDIIAGAAFKRTVTFTAPDVPGMIFPPFPADDIDGLGVYPKRQLLDQANRGSLTGVRRDTITYVCQEPGQFTIPAVRFTWFDVASQRLRTEDFPARTLNVVPNPDLAAADPDAAEASADAKPSVPWQQAISVLILALAAFLAVGSARLRRALAGLLAPFRPVHLQPLNPSRRRGP